MLDRFPWFEDAIRRALGKIALPGLGSHVLGLEELGRGAFGFVLRGYTHLWDRSVPERVRWLVIKAPLPVEVDAMQYTLDNELLEIESEIREAIGEVPGLGVVPTKVTIDRETLLQHTERFWLSRIELPPSIVLLLFPRPDERLAHIPPASLYKLVRHPAGTTRSLMNWCEIARSLGTAIVGMHARGWIHRDLKLENVIAQEEGGFYRSIELIDFGAADRLSQSLSPLVGTMHYWRPERIESMMRSQRERGESEPGLSALSSSHSPFPTQDEDLYALGAMLARVLLGRPGTAARLYAPGFPEQASFAMKEAMDLEAQVADVVRRPEQLDEYLRDELVQAYGLCHVLLKDVHVDSIAAATKLLRQVEHLRVRTLRALEQGSRGEPRRDLQIVTGLLDALEACASPDDERRWCELYLARSVTLTNSGDPLDLEACADLVSRGYATIAMDGLDRLLSAPSGDPKKDARGLVLYVGVLLLRSGAIERGLDMLDRFSDELLEASYGRVEDAPAERAAALRELYWWREMLRARLDHQRGRDVSAQLADLQLADPPPAQETWLLALEVLCTLRRRGRLRHDVLMKAHRLAKRTLETPELLFATLQLARCHAAQGQLLDALRWIHNGIAEAAVRGFPVEYASLLVAAARFVRRGAYDGDLQRRLLRQGVPLEAILERAARLALHAADIFQRIALHGPRDHALMVAGDCAMLRGTPPSTAEAAMWYELSRSNAVLSGSGKEGESVRRLNELRDSWRFAQPDPGASRGRLYFDRYGWVLERVLGTGDGGIELLEDGRPAPGAALRALLKDPEPPASPQRVLVVGCGTGGDVLRLAEMYPEARVLGVDGSSWNIEAAERERSARGIAEEACAFRCVDIAERGALDDEGRRGRTAWDLVVMREILAFVSFKRSYLRELRRHVRTGGEVRLSVPVQRAVCGPERWRKVLQSSWFSSLSTAETLKEDLEWAGFEVPVGPLDRWREMHGFFQSRLEWFHESMEQDAEDLRASPIVVSRIEISLGGLVRASAEEGVLGWVSVRAVAR